MMLYDQFGRKHDYLRISLTDACNFRCTYCMPDVPVKCAPSGTLMRPEEIYTMAKTFVSMGVKKIRLTGGEPLVRKEAGQIMRMLSTLPVELAITTNGVFIDDYIDVLSECGIQSINVSLDSLESQKFFSITKKDLFLKVFSNIELLLKKGFNVKINVVILKDVNEGEVKDFIELTRAYPLHIRFIEFMPFQGNNWGLQKVIPYQSLVKQISAHYFIERLQSEKHDTAKKYHVAGYQGTFAFISAVSNPFCSDCNRMRLTADGKMKNCLFSNEQTDLLGALRKGINIKPLIKDCLSSKRLRGTDNQQHTDTPMVLIGG